MTARTRDGKMMVDPDHSRARKASQDERPDEAPAESPPDGSAGPYPAHRERRRRPRRQRERWSSSAAFLVVCIGATAGLGTFWRGPHLIAEFGGIAYLGLYLLILAIFGVPLLLGELALGRSTRRGVVGAVRQIAGRRFAIVGYLFVFGAAIILAYFAVIGGWILRYAVDSLHAPLWAQGDIYFDGVLDDGLAVLYLLAFCTLITLIAAGGIHSGIERLHRIIAPLFVLLLVAGVVYAAGERGAVDGYAYLFAPQPERLMTFDALAAAVSHAFYSLALGVGALLTYGSYRSRRSNLAGDATIIAATDLVLAVVAGLAIFPILASFGVQAAIGEGSVGALFIELPSIFAAMGAPGRVFGGCFYLALFLLALTTGVAILQVLVTAAREELRLNRRLAAFGAGTAVALLGVLPAYDLTLLVAMDAAASELFLPVGALLFAALAAWRLTPAELLGERASPFLVSIVSGWHWALRIGVPALLLLVLWRNVPAAVDGIAALFVRG